MLSIYLCGQCYRKSIGSRLHVLCVLSSLKVTCSASSLSCLTNGASVGHMRKLWIPNCCLDRLCEGLCYTQCIIFLVSSPKCLPLWLDKILAQRNCGFNSLWLLEYIPMKIKFTTKEFYQLLVSPVDTVQGKWHLFQRCWNWVIMFRSGEYSVAC